jgi:hypothetical protein
VVAVVLSLTPFKSSPSAPTLLNTDAQSVTRALKLSSHGTPRVASDPGRRAAWPPPPPRNTWRQGLAKTPRATAVIAALLSGHAHPNDSRGAYEYTAVVLALTPPKFTLVHYEQTVRERAARPYAESFRMHVERQVAKTIAKAGAYTRSLLIST